MTDYSSWKIDGKAYFPGFALRAFHDGTRELNRLSTEIVIPNDFQVTLEVLERPDIALISALDSRGTKDDVPPHPRFLCYSFSTRDNKHIFTASLVYSYEGPVLINALDDAKKGLLENIDMYHLAPDSFNPLAAMIIASHPGFPNMSSGMVIYKHLERIAGKELQTEGLRELAEKTYFEMLWNVPLF